MHKYRGKKKKETFRNQFQTNKSLKEKEEQKEVEEAA